MSFARWTPTGTFRLWPERTICQRVILGMASFAVVAQLSHPAAVVVGQSGQLYIADTGNNRIRRVALDGTITTCAGTGQPGWSDRPGAQRHAK